MIDKAAVGPAVEWVWALGFRINATLRFGLLGLLLALGCEPGKANAQSLEFCNTGEIDIQFFIVETGGFLLIQNVYFSGWHQLDGKTCRTVSTAAHDYPIFYAFAVADEDNLLAPVKMKFGRTEQIQALSVCAPWTTKEPDKRSAPATPFDYTKVIATCPEGMRQFPTSVRFIPGSRGGFRLNMNLSQIEAASWRLRDRDASRAMREQMQEKKRQLEAVEKRKLAIKQEEAAKRRSEEQRKLRPWRTVSLFNISRYLEQTRKACPSVMDNQDLRERLVLDINIETLTCPDGGALASRIKNPAKLGSEETQCGVLLSFESLIMLKNRLAILKQGEGGCDVVSAACTKIAICEDAVGKASVINVSWMRLPPV